MRKPIALLLVLIVSAVFFAGCNTTQPVPSDSASASATATASPSATATDLRALAETEVKDYEGKNLSSILDFRENSIKGPQFVDIDAYRLVVDGLVNTPMSYTYDEVLAHDNYTKVVTLFCVEGWAAEILWEGVLLRDLFEDAGVKDEAVIAIFHSVDGYTTSLPLDTILDKDLMIAYKMNDVVLPPERGYPFQLVAEDKLGYKWGKWIERIELSDDADYEGYWESFGYSNEADV